MMMRRPSYSKPISLSSSSSEEERANRGGGGGGADWELRPGGMLVQKRSGGQCGTGHTSRTVKVSVGYGSYLLDVTVPAQATFGELKRIVARSSGLEASEQRILFKGKEREDHEFLHIAGVKDASKVVLTTEGPASRERKVGRDQEGMSMSVTMASEAVERVRAEVDKLSQKVCVLESSTRGDKRIPEKEITVLTELLMVQLLKLDSIEADGEVKAQRRVEVRRVQNHVERLDMLKAINANPFNKSDRNRTIINRFDMASKW